MESRVLSSYRAIGIVCGDVPIVYSPLGNVNYVTASIGKCFVKYDTTKLQPVLVSAMYTGKKISAMDAFNKFTYIGVGRDVVVYNNFTIVNTLKGHNDVISRIMCIGKKVILSMDGSGRVKVWSELKYMHDLALDFKATCMVHPNSYLNKVLIGGEDGRLVLWNINTNQCIYVFKAVGGNDVKWSVMENSPAVDVVAIGCENENIMLLNLKLDKMLMEFKQESVTCVSFNTDVHGKVPLMASGSSSGDVYVWNLEKQVLEYTILNAHDGKVNSVLFLKNEPILITSGMDNSIKMWIFDQTDGSPRLLKSRNGHKSCPNKIRYYGNNTTISTKDGSDGHCCMILSAGQDRQFRMFHTAREQMNCELSQGAILKKANVLKVHMDDLRLTPISDFASVETREKDWANIVSCHENDHKAYVWHFQKKCIGKHVLRQHDPNRKGGHTLADAKEKQHGKACKVAVSLCGNFAIVGTSGGCIFKYNMQSGKTRGSFPTALTPQQQLIPHLTLKGINSNIKVDQTEMDKHTSAITGLVVDALNKTLISGSLDGTLKFWDFANHQLLETIQMNTPVCQMMLHRDSNLLCVVSEDQVLRIFDVGNRKLVRRFSGQTHRITDIAFSGDARWLFSSSSDCSIRIWDLPTGRCIDWLMFPKAVTSITVSPTNEYIATTHVGKLGIYVWANKAYYSTVFLDQEPTEPIHMGLPVTLSDNTTSAPTPSEQPISIVKQNHGNTENTQSDVDYSIGGEHSITFSTAPKAFWQTLFNLELIKSRNKPTLPPKAPEKAPFFLPSVAKNADPSVVSQEAAWEQSGQDWDNEESDDAPVVKESTSRLTKSTGLIANVRCRLATLLKECCSDKNTLSIDQTSTPAMNHSSIFAPVSKYLHLISASSTDIELSQLCLSEFDDEGLLYLGYFLEYVLSEIESHHNFQVVQAYLNRFLQHHGDLIAQQSSNAELSNALLRVKVAEKKAWQHLQTLLHQNLSMIQFFSRLQM